MLRALLLIAHVCAHVESHHSCSPRIYWKILAYIDNRKGTKFCQI